jgi:hypothetical protein
MRKFSTAEDSYDKKKFLLFREEGKKGGSCIKAKRPRKK